MPSCPFSSVLTDSARSVWRPHGDSIILSSYYSCYCGGYPLCITENVSWDLCVTVSLGSLAAMLTRVQECCCLALTLVPMNNFRNNNIFVLFSLILSKLCFFFSFFHVTGIHFVWFVFSVASLDNTFCFVECNCCNCMCCSLTIPEEPRAVGLVYPGGGISFRRAPSVLIAHHCVVCLSVHMWLGWCVAGIPLIPCCATFSLESFSSDRILPIFDI